MPRRSPPARRLARLKSSEAFTAFVLDQLDALGGVLPRPMFGGIGLYCGEVFFGIIAGDALYLKVDAGTRAEYERAGMAPFTPYEGRPAAMQYYAVPLEVLEAAPELVAWARKAIDVARTPHRRRRRTAPEKR